MSSKLWYLKNADLFSRMSREEMEELAGRTEMVSCRKKAIFYLTGEPSETVYLVKKGRIKLFRTTADGREIILDILAPGEIFGELAMTGEKQRSHSAEALEEGLVCIIPRQIFEDLSRGNPDFAFRLLKLIGFRFRDLETRVEDLAFRSVRNRLLHTLDELARKHGIPEADGAVRLPVTQSDLAFLIGATREAVADQLKELKEEGLVETSYRAVHLKQPAKGQRPEE